MMMNKNRWLVLGLFCGIWTAAADELWRFLLLADWHSAEKYTQRAKNPEWLEAAVEEDVATVKMLKQNYGGELILMPGDSNGGHWDTPQFIKKNFPGATAEESVLKAGHYCYSGMIDAFRRGGYSRLIMAVGDHEMGDNPWAAGSAVSRCQPQFREAFSREFNRSPVDGRFLYDEPIGKAASRPLGTKYEETSYAYRYKNVLFVTVDAFHQEDPDKKIGVEGSVTGTVTGPHLQWLEKVLSEARKDAGIKHIFVQSHLPVIYPVRKVNSSGMMMDGGMDSPFWETLRKYEVDLYFAGEVHANTVTKDPKSNVVQLVSRGNFFNNFQTLDISDNRIEVTCYNQTGEKPSEGRYEESGRLVIDKAGPAVQIEGSGEFALLQPGERLFHFDFEEKISFWSNPIMGLTGRAKKEDAKTLRGIRCGELLPNRGVFGPHYSALTAHVDLVDGPDGKFGRFGADSRMGVFAMGPHHSGHAISYVLWIKTDADGNRILINSASIWSRELTGFFNLHLEDGVPAVRISDTQALRADAAVNDGQWHQLAAVMPHDGCRLSDVQLYVDGNPVRVSLRGADTKIRMNQAVRLGIGGLNYSNRAFEALDAEPFYGAMDEVSIWSRPVSADEIKHLYRNWRM